MSLAAGVFCAMSCTVASLDLTGKHCPCTAGYDCDLSTDRCVLRAGVGPGAVPGDGLVRVEGLRVAWTTPNVVRWEWTASGVATSFKSYEIVVGANADEVERRVGVVASGTRPELGAFDARGAAGAGTVTVWSTTDASPGKTYYARVVARDTADREHATAVVKATTPAAHKTTKVLFGGSRRSANPADDFAFKAPDGGESDYALTVDCAPAPAPCARRVELFDLKLDLSPSASPFTAGDFDAAFLNVEIEGNVAQDSFDSVMAIEPGAGDCTGGPEICEYHYQGWTQRSGRTRIEVPLRELSNRAGKLTFEALRGKGLDVTAYAMSGTWKQGRTLRLYEARIRW